MSLHEYSQRLTQSAKYWMMGAAEDDELELLIEEFSIYCAENALIEDDDLFYNWVERQAQS